MQKIGRSILKYLKTTDKLLWVFMLSISVYSLLLLRTVPKASGRSYFIIHLIALSFGYIGAVLITLFDYRKLANLWWLAAGFCLILLIYTQLKGGAVESSGGMNTKAWIQLPGNLTFQPSELVKIVFLITFGKHLSVLKERERLIHPDIPIPYPRTV